ncbi:hypothetical protein AX16_003835 [Volvariella volvacea WC 439]|nr:hypothetical protein AX16_003835 [Volvariella volvacea WC 439]
MSHTQQPGAQAPMSVAKPAENTLMREVGEEFAKGAAEEGGKHAVQYGVENGSQTADDAKAQAQGLWAKYCGCLGGS